jgi:hypothetical protein
MAKRPGKRKKSFWHDHSLSIAAAGILFAWVVLYVRSDPQTHIGAFFGNAIADWTGLLMTVLATKYMYERGSAESKPLPHNLLSPALEWLRDHSLSLFFLFTGAGLVVLFASMDSESKWGQVVGNIVSEWTQILGLLLMTKKLMEKKSAEDRE